MYVRQRVQPLGIAENFIISFNARTPCLYPLCFFLVRADTVWQITVVVRKRQNPSTKLVVSVSTSHPGA